MRKTANKPKAAKVKGRKIIPVTMTCKEAAKRHPGIEERHFARLCIKGSWLLKKYGSPERVPPVDRKKALFGEKVGKCWVIPISELDRVLFSQQSPA